MTDVTDIKVDGNIVFIDRAGHLRRYVDAIGPDVIKYLAEPRHFSTDTNDPFGWTTTVVEGGAGASEISASATAGKTIDIVTDNAENDGVSAQLAGTTFELTSDQKFYFGIKFQINDVDQSDLFFGLAVTDTAILGGVTDRIGFQSVDGETDLDFVLEKNSTETASDTGVALADATDIVCEFFWDGSAIEVFVNGASVLTPAVTNLPNDVGLRLSLEFLTGEAAAQTCTVEWLRCIQIGR